jgi:RNA polymerase-binding transcription factor DksA
VTQSRAALRKIEPGSDARCVVCGTPIKFSAREAGLQVIANVYAEDVWQRVEYFHEACYTEAESPYGEVTTLQYKRP